ncbi:glycoside hydrolase [Amycolatopsis roodepoortensis]|uniref:F510_1955 family glycosylhydrolase n=1 Tax=Amycolatopsis roodepoortensis TaxID=700274 RepID=UPI00214B0A8A|nr:sialidase family protein [Amycolatopsis roodepoortensis]UUV35897.1 glycoside hydrolase [Amycolatopsis roodepoortensis]
MNVKADANNRTMAWRLIPLVVAAMVSAACGQSPGPQTSGEHGGADPGLAHVHGLGVDPADGTLYAASHHGAFRLPANSQAERVGDRRQDTMGFTVAGARHFLGSGHPDPRDTGQPVHLGLIESTDAGQTWRSLSLAGKADFHALEAEHGLVYGWDSQTRQLMVSADRQNWDRRARLPLADFAVHPAQRDELLATTPQGLARSVDGGRTFTPVQAAPSLMLLDWPAADTLYGVAPDGSVHVSSDGGAGWVRRGQVPGRPQAVAANGINEVYVATETGIHTSSDGGRTFTLRQPVN